MVGLTGVAQRGATRPLGLHPRLVDMGRRICAMRINLKKPSTMFLVESSFVLSLFECSTLAMFYGFGTLFDIRPYAVPFRSFFFCVFISSPSPP